MRIRDLLRNLLRHAVAGLATIVCAAAYAHAAPPADPGAGAAAFERLRTLVGQWQGEGEGDERLTYELVAGGTALLERETAANRPEMLTVYHLDGNRLLLTHYCMAGNQP